MSVTYVDGKNLLSGFHIQVQNVARNATRMQAKHCTCRLGEVNELTEMKRCMHIILYLSHLSTKPTKRLPVVKQIKVKSYQQPSLVLLLSALVLAASYLRKEGIRRNGWDHNGNGYAAWLVVLIFLLMW